MSFINDEIIVALSNLRKEKPLVHCITNYVTANDCANIILAIGGAPTMADAIEEVDDIESQASALVLNIGILSYDIIETMIEAGRAANRFGIPVVLDPVGVHSSSFRKSAALKILKKVNVTAIRGNLAEIKSLCGMKIISSGVDSIENDEQSEIKKVIDKVSKKYNAIVAVSGEIDYITDGERVVSISNGNSIMAKVTGTGCMSSALVGAFIGSYDDYFIAVVAAVAVMGISGEIALENLKESEGSGTYKARLIDAVYNIKPSHIQTKGNIYEN